MQVPEKNLEFGSLQPNTGRDQEHKAACQLPPAGDCSFFHPATASRMGCSWQLARISSLGRSPCGGIVVQPKASGFLLDSLGSGQHLGLSLSRHRCFFFLAPRWPSAMFMGILSAGTCATAAALLYPWPQLAGISDVLDDNRRR